MLAAGCQDKGTRIVSVVPNWGRAAGGEEVFVRGNGFGSSPGHQNSWTSSVVLLHGFDNPVLLFKNFRQRARLAVNDQETCLIYELGVCHA